MKKIIALALSLILVLSLSVTAFAADYTGTGSSDAPSIPGEPVTGTYTEGDGAAKVFCVDIAWGNLAFTYKADQKGWDTEKHVETDQETGTWSAAGTITVSNHSNVKITATPSFAKTEAEGNEANVTLGAAANIGLPVANGDAATGTISVTPTGKLAKGYNGNIGTITITITEWVEG